MKKITVSVFCLLLSMFAFSQTSYFTVTGKITDSNGMPMQAASVFAQNTTLGTATGPDGNFTLWLPNGGYDLVITFTGYETISKRISSTDTSYRNMLFQLKPKEKAMEEVAIRSSNELKDGLERYGSFFLDNFIGKTANSKQCEILNKEALKFYFSKKRNRLKVLAAAPLEIVNNALGYKIKYNLDSFTHDYNTQVSTFTGYPLFEAMQTADLSQAATWIANRTRAYKGSILHFMRSTYNKVLGEEGFEVQFIVKNSSGSDTAISGLNYYGALNYSMDDSTHVVEISPNQTDIAILYKNEVPDSDYTSLNEDAPKKFELSVISIPSSDAIGIEQNGYYYDQNDITITGYWSWEKVADMLPYDFKVEQ